MPPGRPGPVSRFSYVDRTGKATPLEINATAVETEEGLRILTLCRDISERVQAQAERDDLQRQLLQAQKLESVGRLAGGVAHDFNNMLQVILGNAALALNDVSPGSKTHKELEEIQRTAQRSAELHLSTAGVRPQAARPAEGDRPQREGRRHDQALGAAGRRGHPPRVDSGRPRLARSRRPGAARPRPGQPRGQRAGRHRWRREHLDPDGHAVSGRRLGRLASGLRSWALLGAPRDRHRVWHGRACPGTPVRTVLHHEGAWQGDRARTRDGVRYREAERRLHRSPQRTGARHELRASISRVWMRTQARRMRHRRWWTCADERRCSWSRTTDRFLG